MLLGQGALAGAGTSGYGLRALVMPDQARAERLPMGAGVER